MASGNEDNKENESKASMSIFTLSKTINWMSRAKVLAWFRTSFMNEVTKQLEEVEVSKSRRVSEDIESKDFNSEQHKAKTFYTLPPREEILTLERKLKKNFSKDEDSDGGSTNANEYYKQYRLASQ